MSASDDFELIKDTIIQTSIKEGIPEAKKKIPHLASLFQRKVKKDTIDDHQQDIFDIYREWMNGFLSINIDFYSFDFTSLKITIVEQLTKDHPTDTNRASMEQKATAHLNCDEYRPADKKLDEIEALQKKFNDKMDQFLESHGKKLATLTKEKGYEPEPNSLIMLIRYIFYQCISLHGSGVDAEYRLKHLKLTPITIDILDPFVNAHLENPFPQREQHLLQYIKDNHEIISEYVRNSSQVIIELEKLIKDFKYELKLIIDNKHEGLKGECDYEINKVSN